jgi:hypothetical protein
MLTDPHKPVTMINMAIGRMEVPSEDQALFNGGPNAAVISPPLYGLLAFTGYGGLLQNRSRPLLSKR